MLDLHDRSRSREDPSAVLRAATRPPTFGFLAELMQHPDTTINWAGESAGMVRDIRPAAEIVAEVVADAEARLRACGALVGAWPPAESLR